MSFQSQVGTVPNDLVLVGHVSGAYGIKGWVRVRRYSADADALLHAKTWWLDKPELREMDVMHAKVHGEDVVAQLVGLVDRDVAESLRGATVQVRRSHFPILDDGEYYWIDLIGLQVENVAGEYFGRVHDLMDNGAHPILRVVAEPAQDAVVGAKSEEWLIPFVEQFVKTVDREQKKIVVDWGRDF